MKRVVLGLVMSLLLAAPAQAYTPPELYVRAQRWDTHEETGPWIALAGAPALNYLGGYEIGYKLQASGAQNNFQTVALTIVNVPDGTPTQPSNETPYCVGRAGTPGTIVPAGPELQFEGDGTYTVKVAIGDTTASGCLAGPSTTRSFTVPVRVAPSLVGRPLRFRVDPLPGDPFVGVRAPVPAGGEADVRCALDGTVAPDGSVTGKRTVPDPSFSHPTVAEFVFSRPGTWLCNARGTADGQDENRDTVRFGTPWSAPISIEVGSDFRYLEGKILKPRAKRPKLTFRAEWPAEAQGGRGSVKLYRVTGCTRTRYKLRKAGTFRARFGAKRVAIPVRRARAGYFIARFAFGGTHFLRPMPFTGPIRLGVQRGKLNALSTSEFSGACSG